MLVVVGHAVHQTDRGCCPAGGGALVNVWLNAPVQSLPSVFPDFEETGVLAAGHLQRRGFRQFGYLGFQRDLDSNLQLRRFRRVVWEAGFPCAVHHFPHTTVAGQSACTSRRMWQSSAPTMNRKSATPRHPA